MTGEPWPLSAHLIVFGIPAALLCGSLYLLLIFWMG